MDPLLLCVGRVNCGSSPDVVKGGTVNGARRLLRMNSGLEENLCTIDVADARDQVLRHQNQPNRLLASLDALPKNLLGGP